LPPVIGLIEIKLRAEGGEVLLQGGVGPVVVGLYHLARAEQSGRSAGPVLLALLPLHLQGVLLPSWYIGGGGGGGRRKRVRVAAVKWW